MAEIKLENYYDELLDLARRVFGADKIAAEDVVSDTILSALADIRAGKSIENPAAVINVFVFFGPQLVDWVKSLYRRWKWKQNFKK